MEEVRLAPSAASSSGNELAPSASPQIPCQSHRRRSEIDASGIFISRQFLHQYASEKRERSGHGIALNGPWMQFEQQAGMLPKHDSGPPRGTRPSETRKIEACVDPETAKPEICKAVARAVMRKAQGLPKHVCRVTCDGKVHGARLQ